MFSKYVSRETVLAANFNYWEASTMFGVNTLSCTAYTSYNTCLGINFVVIEATREKGNRVELYFGTFEGVPYFKDSHGDKNKIGEKDYWGRVKNLVRRKNRVAGRDLELKIKDIIRERTQAQTSSV